MVAISVYYREYSLISSIVFGWLAFITGIVKKNNK